MPSFVPGLEVIRALGETRSGEDKMAAFWSTMEVISLFCFTMLFVPRLCVEYFSLISLCCSKQLGVQSMKLCAPAKPLVSFS